MNHGRGEASVKTTDNGGPNHELTESRQSTVEASCCVSQKHTCVDNNQEEKNTKKYSMFR